MQIPQVKSIHLAPNLKDNITSLGKDNDNLKLKITQLKREFDKAKFVKVDLENRFEKLTQILTDPIRFLNDKNGICFDKFAPSMSNSKKKPFFVKSDTEKNFVKRKPVRQIQALRIPKQVSHSQEEVQEMLPFEAYKHILPQPLWCEYCNHKGHLREFCWQVRKMFPRNLPNVIPIIPKPKPKVRSVRFEDRVMVLVAESIKIINELRTLSIDDSFRVRQFERYGKVKTPRVSKV